VLAGEAPPERRVARARLDAARRRIVAGEDFRAVAKELSEGGTKEKGGDLGIITKGDLSSEIDAVVFMLGGGALSEPVETKFGYHLLRVDEKFPVTFLPFEEVKEQVRESYQQKEYEKRLSEYIEKLRKKYFVKVEVEGAGS
jgi:parvulin-like peptidyl-prolyl isomerase